MSEPKEITFNELLNLFWKIRKNEKIKERKENPQ